MSAPSRPECPGCQGTPPRGGLFCTECLQKIPANGRDRIHRAQRAVGERPTSTKVRAEFDAALTSALEALR